MDTNYYPLPLYHDDYLPSFVLDHINGVSNFAMSYEMQHSSVALPFQQSSPLCLFHLEQMRDSLAFQIYFVMCDSLFLVAVIVLAIYSTLFFFLEIKKGKEFRESTSSAGKAKRRFWTFPRIAFLSNVVLLVAVLLSQILFAIYWLVIDFDGVFLLEIIRFIELYYFYSLTFYLAAQSVIKLMLLKVFNP